MKNKIPSFLLEQTSSAPYTHVKGDVSMSFLEKGIHHLSNVIKTSYIQWETASIDGLFQKIDGRIKVIFLFFYVLIVSILQDIQSEIYLWGFVLVLALLSRLNVIVFYKRVVLLGFFFGFLIAFPSAFNIVTEGEILFPFIQLSRKYHFWIYQIPAEIGITREGINVATMLTIRVINSLSIAFLVLSTTPFPDIIKALKILRVPDSFLMIITLSYKYIFIFAKTIEDMHLAKKSRLAREVNNGDARRWITGRIAFLFIKTRLRCEEIFKAMLSKGFTDEVKLYESRKLNSRDLTTGAVLGLIGVLFLSV
jgi:cobalt ECF transporter T component CbiQ